MAAVLTKEPRWTEADEARHTAVLSEARHLLASLRAGFFPQDASCHSNADAESSDDGWSTESEEEALVSYRGATGKLPLTPITEGSEPSTPCARVRRSKKSSRSLARDTDSDDDGWSTVSSSSSPSPERQVYRPAPVIPTPKNNPSVAATSIQRVCSPGSVENHEPAGSAEPVRSVPMPLAEGFMPGRTALKSTPDSPERASPPRAPLSPNRRELIARAAEQAAARGPLGRVPLSPKRQQLRARQPGGIFIDVRADGASPESSPPRPANKPVKHR